MKFVYVIFVQIGKMECVKNAMELSKIDFILIEDI